MTQKITASLGRSDRPSFPRTLSDVNMPMLPFAAASLSGDIPEAVDGVLELVDGSAYRGISFGAEKSISGECVFQTGFVPEPLFS